MSPGCLGFHPARPPMILRNEQAVIPIGCYNPEFGVTLSAECCWENGVERIIEPDLSDAERQGLQRSAEAIKAALSRLKLTQQESKMA